MNAVQQFDHADMATHVTRQARMGRREHDLGADAVADRKQGRAP